MNISSDSGPTPPDAARALNRDIGEARINDCLLMRTHNNRP